MAAPGVTRQRDAGKLRGRIEAPTAFRVHDRIRHRDDDLRTCASATSGSSGTVTPRYPSATTPEADRWTCLQNSNAHESALFVLHDRRGRLG
jgi:hypothetical protein